MDRLEEIKKLKLLLDEGIIDEQDFQIKKSQILGIKYRNEESSNLLESENSEEEIKTKRKSLDDYEKELLNELETIEKEKLNISTTNNCKIEKLNEDSKLELEEENLSNKKNEKKELIYKGVNKIERIFKSILSIILWMLGLAYFFQKVFKIHYLLTGIIFVVLGLMSFPKLTDKTQKYEQYTIYKSFIVWVLSITLIIFLSIFK